MTVEEIRRGLSLFGFNLQVTDSYVAFEHKNVLVSVKSGITEDEVKLLLLNIPNWFKLVEESV